MTRLWLLLIVLLLLAGCPSTNVSGKGVFGSDVWTLDDATQFGTGWHCFNLQAGIQGKGSVEMHYQSVVAPPVPSGR